MSSAGATAPRSQHANELLLTLQPSRVSRSSRPRHWMLPTSSLHSRTSSLVSFAILDSANNRHLPHRLVQVARVLRRRHQAFGRRDHHCPAYGRRRRLKGGWQVLLSAGYERHLRAAFLPLQYRHRSSSAWLVVETSGREDAVTTCNTRCALSSRLGCGLACRVAY